MSYEAWRITFQDSEQAARTAYNIFNMSITCLAELYEALGVGGVNETFQQHEALKAINTLKANSMAAAMEHIAFCCATYAGVHDLEERAKGARSMGSMALGKAQALREGRLTPDFIYKTRGALSAPTPNDSNRSVK
jgi:hypothetical protein